MDAKRIIEAALFISSKPVPVYRLCELVSMKKSEVERLIEELRKEYEERGSPIEIIEIDERYTMQLKHEYAEAVREFAPTDLSSSVLRTLAVIVSKQPIKQSDLVKIRGNKAYEHIEELERRKLIEVRPFGRTKLIRTSRVFLEYFGVKNVEELKKKIEERLSHEKP
ncbi:MAG: SMC-Scp complex subunit ScpB [Archaeoglobi archaeon]|nr:SMC-Scp complex subunit ScpB [Candidatus Mnemosynella sp.]